MNTTAYVAVGGDGVARLDFFCTASMVSVEGAN